MWLKAAILDSSRFRTLSLQKLPLNSAVLEDQAMSNCQNYQNPSSLIPSFTERKEVQRNTIVLGFSVVKCPSEDLGILDSQQKLSDGYSMQVVPWKVGVPSCGITLRVQNRCSAGAARGRCFLGDEEVGCLLRLLVVDGSAGGCHPFLGLPRSPGIVLWLWDSWLLSSSQSDDWPAKWTWLLLWQKNMETRSHRPGVRSVVHPMWMGNYQHQPFESWFSHLKTESSANSCFLWIYWTLPLSDYACGLFSTEPSSNECPINMNPY